MLFCIRRPESKYVFKNNEVIYFFSKQYYVRAASEMVVVTIMSPRMEVISFSLSPEHFGSVISELEAGHCSPEHYHRNGHGYEKKGTNFS